ncbi:MAG: hypothetical protein OXH72_08790 [Caldilineaceae bacterium]|nr:hypothetical protein [Caldilineaceae bacterium]
MGSVVCFELAYQLLQPLGWADCRAGGEPYDPGFIYGFQADIDAAVVP